MITTTKKRKPKITFAELCFFLKKNKFFFPSLDLSLKKESKEYLNPHSCACIKQFLWWFFTKDSSFCHIILQPKTSLNQKNHQILTFFRRKLFFNCSYAQPVFFRFAKLQHESSNKRVLIAAVRDVPFAILWKGHWTISLTHAHTL